MHIVILTTGTRGDVQPYVAVARGLMAAGYDVTLAACPEFEDFVTMRGVAFRAFGPPLRPLLDSDLGREFLETADDVRAYCRVARALYLDYARSVNEIAEEALADADAILFYPISTTAAFVAEKMRVPVVALPPWPAISTAAFGYPGMPEPPLFKGVARKLGWSVAHHLYSYVFREPAVELRERLGLPPMRSYNLVKHVRDQGVPYVHLISEHVLPRPSDWDDDVEMAGFCHLREADDWQPDNGLADFIDAGEAPISIGFGSMMSADPKQLSRIITEALERTGVRAVLVGGWSNDEMSVESDDVYTIDQVPHDWLFPRMAALVHHGGAGTTAAGLRAGTPTVVCSFFADQPLWGDRVAALGAGPDPLARKTLTADGLAAAIERATTDVGIQRRAAALGEKLRAEDGVANAVAAIERYIH